MRGWLLSLALPVGSIATVGCHSQSARHEFREMAMGTECRIVVCCPDAASARTAARAAFAKIHALDEILSDWVSSSAVRTLPSIAGTSTNVDPDLNEALTIALEVAEGTEGRFDPTVGPLVQLWRRARNTGKGPSDLQRLAAMSCTGYASVIFDPQTGTLMFQKDNMAVDFGGIAKGMAAAEALGIVRSHGHDLALVSIGGDIALGSAPTGSNGWLVEIDDGLNPVLPLYLSNCSISTSGDLEQWAMVEGIRRGHIIDPETGFPVAGRRAATTSVGWTRGASAEELRRAGAISDAVASALCVADPSEAEAMLMNFPTLKARVTQETEAGSVQCGSWGIPCQGNQ